jgi:meiosis-specific protein HOP1
MSLDDDFEKMSLGATGDSSDPVAAASKLGRKPTLKEVKRSVKVCLCMILRSHTDRLGQSMLKRLIHATCTMESLPSECFTIRDLEDASVQSTTTSVRRYATFKLFYYAHTPPDYEPPYFRAGDAEKDKWFFSTHDETEVPDKCSVGNVATPFHT